MDTPRTATKADSHAGRRGFLKGVGATATATFAAGCSSFAMGRGTTGTSSGGEVVLEYVDVSGARSREMFRPILDELERRHGVPVELRFVEIPYGNMKSQLFTRMGGNNAPDVAAVDQIWLGAFIDSGKLLSLDPVVDDVDFDDYLPTFREPVRENGRVNAVPISTDVRGMYWNRDVFEAAGLDPDTPPATWSDLLDTAARVHDPPETYGAGYFVVSGRWIVSLFCAGGDVLNDDATEPRFQEPPGVEAARFLDELYNEADVSSDEPPYRKGSEMAREFLTGQYGITVVEGSWLDYFWRNLGNDDESMVERFGFAPPPRPEGGTVSTMSGGFTWVGFEGTDHPDVVRDFLRIASGREFKRRLAIESGKIPVRESLLDESEIWDNVLYSETVRDLLQQTRTRPIRNWPVVAEQLNPALQRVAFDRAEPKVALDEAAGRVREALSGSTQE